MVQTNNFSKKLREFRIQSGFSQNSLAKEIGVNASYINRIEKGEREAPRRDVIISISRALDLPDHRRDELLLSANYAPMIADEVDLSDPRLRLMAELLDDEESSPDELADRLLDILLKKVNKGDGSENK